jgi:hypothetical protein
MNRHQPIPQERWILYYGTRGSSLVEVVPDDNWPGMWRVRQRDGSLTDMANLTRAKDSALAIARQVHPEAAAQGSRRFHWKQDMTERPLRPSPVRQNGRAQPVTECTDVRDRLRGQEVPIQGWAQVCASLAAEAQGMSQAWMVVQAFPSQTGEDGNLTNSSDFDRFTTLIGTAPVIEGVRVRISWVWETRSLIIPSSPCSPLCDPRSPALFARTKRSACTGRGMPRGAPRVVAGALAGPGPLSTPHLVTAPPWARYGL